jgi:hypothetical protein
MGEVPNKMRRSVIKENMIAAGAMSALFSLFAVLLTFSNAEFEIVSEPTFGEITVGNIIQANLNITTKNGYSYPISLATNDLPAGIKVSFSPQNGVVPSFISIMNIEINYTLLKEIPKDGIPIKIIAMGSNGASDSCNYNLR